MASKHSGTAAATEPPGADDYKLIKGIGPGIESRLHSAGILTYAQLADLSPDELAALVEKIAGVTPERIIKQNWIGQARALAAPPAEARPPAEAPSDAGATVLRQHYATFTVELLLDEDNNVRRTRVVHIQGGNEDTWAGWQDARLAGFFVERAGIRSRLIEPGLSFKGEGHHIESSDEHMMPAVEAPTEEPAVARDTEQLPVIEAPIGVPAVARDTEARAEPPSTSLRLHLDAISLDEVSTPRWVAGRGLSKHLRAQAAFRLSGTAADQVSTDEAPYVVQILACELATGRTTVLAVAHERLRTGQLDYTATLEFGLPPAGRYQIQGIILLPPAKAAGARLGPVLKVV